HAMGQTTPEELRDWGPVQGEVWGNLKWNWFIRIGVGLFLGTMWVLSVLLFTMDPPRDSAAQHQNIVRGFLWVTAAFTLAGGLVIWHFHRTSDTRVIALAKGLATVRGGKVRAISYADIAEIEVKRIPMLGGNYANESGWTRIYRVHSLNGDMLEMNGNHYT